MNIIESNKTYIHYSNIGAKHFSKVLFTPVSNRPMFNKPAGGLWGSPIDASFGWKEWNEEENFRNLDPVFSFKFKLKPGNRVLTLRSYEDCTDAPMVTNTFKITYSGDGNDIFFDFEALKRVHHVDAIELENESDFYWPLYGWDCQSIVILNPDAIVEVRE